MPRLALCSTLALALCVLTAVNAQTRWYPVQADPPSFAGTALDLSRFVEAPTGKHGFLKAKNGHFAFDDGTPARFFGAQINPFGPEEVVSAVRRMRERGINITRLHGLEFLHKRGSRSLFDYDAAAFDRLDRLIAELGKNGIYLILDTDYPMIVHIGADDGIEGIGPAGAGLMFAEFFNPRVMALKQRRMREIFTHRNPYTGKRYSDDPTLALVEIQNEDSMFWYGVDSQREPFKTQLVTAFREWLARRDGKAPAEPVTIQPMWVYREKWMNEHPAERERALDQLRFFDQLERNFWDLSVQVLRAAGVKVPITGTNWQGGGFSTRVHLYGQSKLDYVDRHGYWDHPQGEGNSLWNIATAQFINQPMVRAIEVGVDLKQENNVGNLVLAKAWERIFGLPMTISEWNTCLPNEYSLEGTLLMAAYGLMQGWSGDLQFGYFSSGMRTKLGPGSFDLLANPPQILQFPAAAMLWHRGDVREGGVVAERVYTPQTVFAPQDDVLPLPLEAALVGKVGYRFSTDAAPPVVQDITAWRDVEHGIYRSMTGELAWNAKDGVVTIDTPRTQAVVGFLSARNTELAAMKLKSTSRFGSVAVSVLDAAPDVRQSRHLLVSLIGQAKNEGIEWEQTAKRAERWKTNYWHLKSVGEPPAQLAAIEGELRIASAHVGQLEVWTLGLDGKRQKRAALHREKGAFVIDLSATPPAAFLEIAAR